MIIRFLRYIKRQPKIVRDQYAIAISAVFTGIVALVWFFNSVWMQDGGNLQLNNVAKENNVPFASLVNQLKEQWQGLTNSLPKNNADLSQTAAVAGSQASETTANPQKIILTTEEVTAINEQQKTASSTAWQASTSVDAKSNYQEVQIVTTSSTKATTTN